MAGGTVWGEVTEGPEFPAPLAFAAPGLCLLPRTRMMDDFACLMRSRGPAPFLVLPSPLPFFFFSFLEVKQIVLQMELAFIFFHGIFVESILQTFE